MLTYIIAPEMEVAQLMLVSIGGLFVNLFGMFAMGGHHHHHHGHCSHSHSHSDKPKSQNSMFSNFYLFKIILNFFEDPVYQFPSLAENQDDIAILKASTVYDREKSGMNDTINVIFVLKVQIIKYSSN